MYQFYARDVKAKLLIMFSEIEAINSQVPQQSPKKVLEK